MHAERSRLVNNMYVAFYHFFLFLCVQILVQALAKDLMQMLICSVVNSSA